ncbi:MAG: septum site-determining protein MinD [Clostridiales bacterium]|nr:septum site-determining protein MinD [Clostridiales bacterium]
MSKAIVFSSGKGGVGKSTLTLSVGRALADMGHRVALMDTDIGLNNLDVLMGVERSIIYDVTDVIENRCRLSQALIADKLSPSLFLLPSAHSYEQCHADGQNFKEIVSRLKATHDYVFIDCPAGIEFGFHRAVAAADEAIVVTSAHLSALKDASKVAALIRSYKIPVQLVLNRVRGDMLLSGETLTVEEIGETMNVQILGVVPEDDAINMVSSGASQIRRGDGRSAIKLLAQNICSSSSELYDATKKYRGLFGGIKRKLRGRV